MRKKLICVVEQAIGQVESNRRDEAQTRAVGILAKLPRNPSTPLLVEECNAIKSLRSIADIVVLPADKGNATVILNSNDYVEKMTDLLTDDNTYVALKRDPTLKIEKNLQSLLADVFQMVPPQYKSSYFRLLCHNGSTPALYGLPKIHKLHVPMRPIVDSTRSPLFRLYGYLHKVLAPLVGKGSTFIRNSSDFIEKVRDITVDEDEIMVSFDVKTVTSIQVDLAVQVCQTVLEHDDGLSEGTPIEAFFF